MGKTFYIKIKTFEGFAKTLAGCTRRCSISFVTLYPKVQRKLSRELHEAYPVGISLDEWLELTAALQKNSSPSWDAAVLCCLDELCAVDGMKKGGCVDAAYLSEIFQIPHIYPKWPTRESCGCYESYDIGFYNTCSHGCVYCYANVSHASIKSKSVCKIPRLG